MGGSNRLVGSNPTLSALEPFGDGLERPASKGRDGADCKSGMDVTYDEELVELAVASGSSAFVALDLSTAVAYGVAS